MELSNLELEDKRNFELVENDEQEQSAEKRNAQVRNWVGTWNNPSMTDDEFEKFFIDLHNSNLLEYAIFQREKGENTGTIHFQFFVTFKNARYFTWVKKTLPYGCHFKPMISTKERCKNYCSKPDTRVNPPREIGEFVSERARTDLLKALKMQDEGVAFEIIESIFPTQVFMYRNLFKQRAEDLVIAQTKNVCRNVEVTYLYGPPRSGKTSYVYKKYGIDNVFVIDNYGEYQFTGYAGEKVIIFDEFTGQVRPITKMNKLLEPYPLKLNIKGGITPARFEKIFIISNSPLTDLYKDEKKQTFVQYQAFMQRINKIVRFDKFGNQTIEQETVFEVIPENEQELTGLTKRVSKVIKYEKGNPIIMYDREKSGVILTPIKDEDMTFKEEKEDIQEVLKF